MITRRELLSGLTAAGGFAVSTPRWAASEPSPETGTIRVSSSIAICTAPQLVSEDLLRAEGFYSLRLREAGSRALTGGF
jgi:hypothetical protein